MDEPRREIDSDARDIIARIMLEMEDVIGLIQTPRSARPALPLAAVAPEGGATVVAGPELS